MSNNFLETIKRQATRLTLAFAAALLLASIPAFGANAPKAEAATSAQVVSEKWIDSRTLDITVSSPSIDSFTKRKNVRLLVPEGWSKTSATTYPTLWLLHGGGDDYKSWTKNTDVAAATKGKDVIVVMADTSWCSAYSDWWNYGKYGAPAWETYMTAELPGILSSQYRANDSRAIAGVSMGGLGALKLPANHQELYQAAASFSGNVDTLHSYNNTTDGPDLPGLGCAADWKRVWGDYRIPEQRAIWQRNNPYDQADKLASLDYLYVASGNGQADPLNGSLFDKDTVEQGVYRQGQALTAKLQQLNIPVESHFYDGTHSWPYWQEELHAALPGLLQAINVK